MASIIENLITELNDEYALYEQLLQVSMEKTGAIVSNNLDRLSETPRRSSVWQMRLQAWNTDGARQ